MYIPSDLKKIIMEEGKSSSTSLDSKTHNYLGGGGEGRGLARNIGANMNEVFWIT